MPSETYYVDREHIEYLDELCNKGGHSNPSEAIRSVIDDHMGANL